MKSIEQIVMKVARELYPSVMGELDDANIKSTGLIEVVKKSLEIWLAQQELVAWRIYCAGDTWVLVDTMPPNNEAVKAEREACAKLCEMNALSWADTDWNNAVADCAKAIRKRGEKK